MGDLATILDLAQKLTITGGLLLLIWGGVKQVWVWGWLYNQMVATYEARIAALTASYETRLAAEEKNSEFWQQRALDQYEVNKSAANSLSKLAEQTSKGAPAGGGSGT